LEEQAKALFKSWFIDFEPFKGGKFVDSELGKIPKGWNVKYASDIFNITIGKTPPRKESKWFTKGIGNVWVSISDMKLNGAFIGHSSEKLSDDAIAKFNIVMVPKDTILLSFKLTIGRVAISSCDLTTNEAIARFSIDNPRLREFTYLFLKNYNYQSLGSTSSIATAVNSKIIKSMPFLLPDADTTESFHKLSKPLFDQIEVTQKQTYCLASIRDTLLPKLMSGEIDVEHSKLLFI
jgi:type I restriction enzyme S subunit